MTTTQLIHILSSHAELPVAVRLRGYVSFDDPRDGHNQSAAATLDHYNRLSSCRSLAPADVVVTSNPKTGEMSVEIAVRIHVSSETGEESVEIGMMSAEDVVGVPLQEPSKWNR
jgi:hypothetical protein